MLITRSCLRIGTVALITRPAKQINRNSRSTAATQMIESASAVTLRVDTTVRCLSVHPRPGQVPRKLYRKQLHDTNKRLHLQ